MKDLLEMAKDARKSIIEMTHAAGNGHPGGSLSAVEILTVLWFDEMRGVEPGDLKEDRDRFILSKGHGVPALYATLAQRGHIPTEELKTFRHLGSRLQGHPDRVRLPIVEASTGSLGQGLSVAQGMALAARADGHAGRVFCLLGDGEIQEGQVWEAAMSAPKFELSNLCAILDYNKGQIDGQVSEVMPLEPIADKWRAFGWHVLEVDGHDLEAIRAAFREARDRQEKGEKKPVFVIANTIKGKGVSFMEGVIKWHGVAPNAEETKQALAEIEKGLN